MRPANDALGWPVKYRVPHLVAAMVVTLAVHASDQPPVRYLVEVRKAGAVVDCPSGEGVLGQKVRIPLSAGSTVVALAQPRGADGRSRIVIRVEALPVEPGGLEFAQEISNSLDLAIGNELI